MNFSLGIISKIKLKRFIAIIFRCRCQWFGSDAALMSARLTIWRPFYLVVSKLSMVSNWFDYVQDPPILIRIMIGHGVEKSVAIIEQRFPKCSQALSRTSYLMQDAQNFR
jgi:hypothetical protein